MIYEFNQSCLENVKKYPSLRHNLNTDVENSPVMEDPVEMEAIGELFEAEDVEGVMDICQVNMVIDDKPKNMKQDCYSGVFDAFLEKRQTKTPYLKGKTK